MMLRREVTVTVFLLLIGGISAAEYEYGDYVAAEPEPRQLRASSNFTDYGNSTCESNQGKKALEFECQL